MKIGGWLHAAWWRWSDACLPLWVWRPYCWFRGHRDDSYGRCIFCGAASAGEGNEEGS